jgi:hypothetical protein
VDRYRHCSFPHKNYRSRHYKSKAERKRRKKRAVPVKEPPA